MWSKEALSELKLDAIIQNISQLFCSSTEAPSWELNHYLLAVRENSSVLTHTNGSVIKVILLFSQVPKSGHAPPRSDVTAVISETQGGKKQLAYKAEIIGGVVVHTPIQVKEIKM